MICSQSSKQIFMLGKSFALFLSFQYKCIFLLGRGSTHFFLTMLLCCEAIRRKKTAELRCFCLFVQYFFFLRQNRRVIMHSCIRDRHAVLLYTRVREEKNPKSHLETRLLCLYFLFQPNFLPRMGDLAGLVLVNLQLEIVDRALAWLGIGNLF